MKFIKTRKLYEEVFKRQRTLPSDRVMSAEDLLDTEFAEGLEFEGKYSHLFGAPAPNFSMMLFGPPASGKSSFALEFAVYLTNFGKVLYISSEEYGSVTLQDKVQNIIDSSDELQNKLDSHNLDKPDSKTPDNLFFAKAFTDLEGYDFIFIDSVNDLDVDLMDYKEVRDIYPKSAWVNIMQVTKNEDEFKGGKSWEHEMDIAAEINEGIVDVYKNRFDKYGSYDIFNDKVIPKDITHRSDEDEEII